MIRPLLRIAVAPLAISVPLQAQTLDTTGVSDTFSSLFNPRMKTFIHASSDPQDLLVPPSFGNDDGFSGTNQVEAYRETIGLQEFAVLTHQEGRPGYMSSFFRNFWGGLAGQLQLPFENTRGQILIEDQILWDLPLMDYFRSQSDPLGQVFPFTGPFTESRAGGHITFTPIVWEDSFKLRVFENWFDNAARFHRVTGTLGTWDDVLEVPDISNWEDIAVLAYQNNGAWPHQTPRMPTQTFLSIPAGGSQTIALTGPSTLLELTARIGNPAQWDGVIARFTFDNQAAPSVDLPLRFLGSMVRQPFSAPVTSLLMNNNGSDQVTCYFPMHFTSSATLEFINNDANTVDLSVDYATGSGAHPEPWGYFTATYNEGLTQTGVAFPGPVINDAHGMLRFVAVETSINNIPGSIPGNVSLQHIEGDLCVRINENKGDDHVFAATETSIGHWGWYDSPSDVPFETDCSFHTGLMSVPLSPTLFETDRMMGSTFVFDPVHYVDGIDVVLEHGPGNTMNAFYKFVTFHYVSPGQARDVLIELDVGDPTDEATRGAAFTQVGSEYTLTHGFFRDTQYQTPSVQDTVRTVDSFYRFVVSEPNQTSYDAFCVGVRLDRDRPGDGGICQADVYVDGVWAGLVHGMTSNQFFRWKEGGELEVEIPRALTAGKSSFTIEFRPRASTESFNLARAWVYGYL